MIEQLIFTQIELQLEEDLREQLANLKQSNNQVQISLTLLFGHSFDTVSEYLTMQQIKYEDQLSIEFQKEISLLIDANNKNGSAQIVIKHQSTFLTFLAQISVLEKKGTIIAFFKNNQSQPICRFTSQYRSYPKKQMPFIQLNNVACQLKDNIINPGKQRFLQIEIGQRKYRNMPLSKIFHWESPFKFSIEKNTNIKFSLVERYSLQKIDAPIQEIDDFTLLFGFRRIYIIDQSEMPKGCIQFYYQTCGLRSKQEYEKLAALQENSQKLILKLTIKTIRIKLKIPHKNVRVRAFSNLNFILTTQQTNKSNQFLYEVNEYIYLDPKENKCNLTIYYENKILGNAILLLNMVGFFERKLKIIGRAGQQLGMMMINIESERIVSNSIQLAKLRLNLGDFFALNYIFYLSFKVKGYYTRTELRKPEDQILQFRRLILMKYKNQQKVQISLSDSENNVYFKTLVDILFLTENKGRSVSKKSIILNSDSNCILNLLSIDGDLNKINIEQQVRKLQIEQRIKESSNNNLLQSVARHIKVPMRDKLVQGQRKSRSNSFSQNNQEKITYRLMYLSKRLTQKNNAQRNSPQKGMFKTNTFSNEKYAKKRFENIYKIQLPILRARKSLNLGKESKLRYNKQ